MTKETHFLSLPPPTLSHGVIKIHPSGRHVLSKKKKKNPQAISFYSEALAEKPEEEWKPEEGDFQILQGVEAHFVKQFCPHPFPFLPCLNYTLTDKCLSICLAKLSPIFHIFTLCIPFPSPRKNYWECPEEEMQPVTL